jgi:hypothetical protein
MVSVRVADTPQVSSGAVHLRRSFAGLGRRRLLWVAGLTGLVIVFSIVRVVHRRTPTPPTGVSLPKSTLSRAAQEAQLAGAWTAKGRIFQTGGFVNDREGQMRVRRWAIASRCASAGCMLYLTVPTIHGPRSAPLVWSDGRWVSTMRLASDCESPDGSRRTRGTMGIRRTLTLTVSGLRAIEQDEAPPAGNCPKAYTAWQWTASRAGGAVGDVLGPICGVKARLAAKLHLADRL